MFKKPAFLPIFLFSFSLMCALGDAQALEDQIVVLTQGVIEYTQPDIYAAEMRMLLPIILHPQAESILIIGGNLHGFIESIDQFNTNKKITFLEKDPFLLHYQKELVQKQAPTIASVRFVKSDVRSFLNKAIMSLSWSFLA